MDIHVFDRSFMECFLAQLREMFGSRVDYDYILSDIGSNAFETAFEKAARQSGAKALNAWQEAQKLEWDAADDFEAGLVKRFKEFGLLS